MIKFLKIAGLVLLVLVVVIVAALPTVVRAIAFWGEPELRAGYEDFQTKPLDLPAGILVAEPPSAETMTALNKFAGLYKDGPPATLTKLSKKAEPALLTAPSPEEVRQIKQELAPFSPLLEAYRELVAQPDYDMELAGLNPDLRLASGEVGVPQPDVQALQTMAKLCALRAYLADAEGRPADALAWTQAMWQSARARRGDPLITQLAAVGVIDQAIALQRHLLRGAKDRAILTTALEQSREAAGWIHPLTPETAGVTDLIGIIRQARLHGVKPPEIPERPTYEQLYAAATATRALYMEQVVLPKAEGKLKQAAEANIEAQRLQALYTGGIGDLRPSFWNRYAGSLTMPMLYKILVPNLSDAGKRQQKALAQLEGLNSDTARQLAQAEGDAPAGAGNELASAN